MIKQNRINMALSLCLGMITFIISFNASVAFYLPGSAPVTYCESAAEESGECTNEVPVFVNRLNSLDTFIPYEYDRFDFCQTDEKEKDPAMNLGQVVFGERIRPSPYKLKFNEDVPCMKLCEKKYFPGNKTSMKKLNFMRKSIELNYQQNWILDNMPVTWCYQVENGYNYCSRSFPVGCYVTKKLKKKDTCVISAQFNEADTYYFFNHLELTIQYQPGKTNSTNAGRIISTKVEPKSVAYYSKAQGDQMCTNYNVMGIKGGRLIEETTVRYTYSVKWEAVYNTKWASRWDYILDELSMKNIQWFSVFNSMMIVVFMTGLLLKLVWKMLSKSTTTTKSEKTGCFCKKRKNENQFNWKLIYGDIFRPPSCGMLLAVFVGSGVQLCLTSALTLVFAALGILSPPNRGALETSGLAFFVCLGFPAGYVSARLYKGFGGEKKLLNALLTAVVCPGAVFLLVLVMNVAFMAEGSSAAIPGITILALTGLWLGISLPLTFLGSFFGFRKKLIKHPVQTDPTPRHIPKLKLCLKPLTGNIIGGILPFGTIFIQTFFILNSICAHQVYYTFGLLALVFLLMGFTCCLVAIILCYFHLCAEDYRWWWRAFLNTSFTAVYFYIYCIHYYVTKAGQHGVISAFIFFGYMFIVAFLLFLITGTIGFFSCFWFVRKVYGSMKGHNMWSTKGSEVDRYI